MDPEQPVPDDALKKEWELIKASHTEPRFFESLYHKHYNQVFRFVYSRTRVKELSADITADVFLKAMVNLKNYTALPFPTCGIQRKCITCCMHTTPIASHQRKNIF